MQSVKVLARVTEEPESPAHRDTNPRDNPHPTVNIKLQTM